MYKHPKSHICQEKLRSAEVYSHECKAQTCHVHALPTPATAPRPAAAADAAAPPSVSGAEEWRGEKYTRGISCTGAQGCPRSQRSASVLLGRGTCAYNCDFMPAWFTLHTCSLSCRAAWHGSCAGQNTSGASRNAGGRTHLKAYQPAPVSHV